MHACHLAYIVENRVERVTVDGQTTQFVYDGDGTRVAKMTDGVTTVYVGGIYEKQVESGSETKYYCAAAQRVAMRKDGELFCLVNTAELTVQTAKFGYGTTDPTWETRISATGVYIVNHGDGNRVYNQVFPGQPKEIGEYSSLLVQSWMRLAQFGQPARR